MNLGRLILQGVHRREAGRPGEISPDVERALDAGVAGFVVFGGDLESVRAWAQEVRRRAGRSVLLATDAERGAGQQFRGATSLPPPRALAALPDRLEAIGTAARITAQELRAAGLNWALAPVADLDIEAENPIVGTRSFGSEPVQVSECVRGWVAACQSLGVLACAKHFPGHGRTTTDSHLGLPVVAASRAALEADLAPFRAAMDAGVASVMSAHVAYPALDPSGAPASQSRPILTGLLRESFGFDGLIVSDALGMAGALGNAGSEVEAALRALEAGSDLLLAPSDLEATLGAIGDAARRGRLAGAQLERSAQRVERAAGASVPGSPPEPVHARWALEAARRSIQALKGEARPGGRGGRPAALQVALVDDDVVRLSPEALAALGLEAQPPAPSRRAFFETLERRGFAAVRVLRDPDPWGSEGEPVILCFADVRGFKGRAGLSAEAEAAVARRLRHRPEALLVLFGHPRLGHAWPHARTVVCAWSGDEVMQRAAAEWLADVWEGVG